MQWKEEEPKCPACGAAAASQALECAVCGVIFEKWRKKSEKEQPMSGRSLSEPPPVLIRESDQSGALVIRVMGGAALLVSAAFAAWLISPGSSRPLVPGSASDPENGFSLEVPAGWSDRAENDCGGIWSACTIRLIDRGDSHPDRFLARLSVKIIPRGPQALGSSGRSELEGKLKDEILAGVGEGAVGRVVSTSFDGVSGFRLEGRGKKHVKIETSAAVVTNAQAYLAEQQRQNPGKGVYSVMATNNPRNFNNPTVTLKEAEYAEFDARPVLGRVVVPLRSKILLLSYQYDEADEASFSSGLDEILASLRVTKRPRPMDGLGGASAFFAFSAAAGLALTGLKLVRS